MNDVYSVAYLRDKFLNFKDANLSIASSAILYGLSTYTVISAFKSKDGNINLFRLHDHFRRLSNSSKILSFDDFLKNWDEQHLEQTLRQLIRRNKLNEDALIRIVLFVDGISSGTRMLDIPTNLAIFMYRPPTTPKAGSRLIISSWRRTADNAIPARAKVSGSYVNSSLMKNEALSRGFDDAIALDQDGHVAESTVSNIFIVNGGKLFTPSSHNDILEGITRDSIFKLAKDLKLKAGEKTIDRSELYTADEVFLSGSSLSICPVISIDGKDIGNGKPGPITIKISQSYQKVTHALMPDTYHWLTKV